MIIVLFNIAFFFTDAFFYNLKHLPTGELLSSSVSPNHKYKVEMYVIDAGGNLGEAVRGQVTELETGETRNLYWEAGINSATVSWGSKNSVIINNRPINVQTEHFDWRDEISSRKIIDNTPQ